MKDITQNIELIERYFDNEMSEEEKARFRESLKTDLELKHLFDRESLLINTVRYGAAKKTLEFLKDLDGALPEVELNNTPSGAETKWKYYGSIAAAVIVLIISGVFMLTPDSSNEELYAEYFEPYPNVFEPSQRSADGANQRAEAFKAYENGEYTKAAFLFNTMLQVKKEPTLLLLLGISNLELKKPHEAQANFSELLADYDDYDLQAKWFLGLTYLKQSKIPEAKKVLRELADGESSYAPKARGLLKKMD